MRRIICILICVGTAAMASALSITNGDFEALGVREDVPYWFDYNMGTGAAGTYLRLLNSPNGTQYMGFADDNSWAYQSIGFNTGGLPALQIRYDIGRPTNAAEARDLVVTISIYESDGSFAGSDGPGSSDIDGAEGVKLIDSVRVSYPAVAPGQIIADSVTLHYLNAAVGELFLRFENTGDNVDETEDAAIIDNVQIGELPSVVNPLPKDGTHYVAVERISPENDLIFTVADSAITKIDVLFASDPNLSAANKIVAGKSVAPGQYTITLENELPQDLAYSTDYFWKVLAYEPNGIELSLKYTSPVWSFTTRQKGPYLGAVDPSKRAVHPGEDAVFALEFYNNADAFQWYKVGSGALTNGAKYAGVNTDTLTVRDAQLSDAGFYYCVGTETATGLTAQSLTNGELKIKQLMTYYPFETTYSAGGKIYTPDIISGKDMELKNGASLSGNYSLVGNNLWLDNPKNQYAQIADNTVAHYEDITISFWCYATTLVNTTDGDRWARIFDFGKDSTEYIFFTLLYRQDDPRQNGLDVARCELRYFDSEGVSHNPELDVEHPDIAAGRWYYVAITIEADEDGQGGTGRIYFGGEHGTETETPQIMNIPKMTEITKTLHYIGKNIGFTAPYFNGRIDEFKIYNYARTKEEIAQEYYGITGDESVCDMENYDLYDWDYDRNCVVNLPDFAKIAARWLEDYRIYPE